jgi:hypothetical protein
LAFGAAFVGKNKRRQPAAAINRASDVRRKYMCFAQDPLRVPDGLNIKAYGVALKADSQIKKVETVVLKRSTTMTSASGIKSSHGYPISNAAKLFTP